MGKRKHSSTVLSLGAQQGSNGASPEAVDLRTQHRNCLSLSTCLPVMWAMAEPRSVAANADVALPLSKHQTNIHHLPDGKHEDKPSENLIWNRGSPMNLTYDLR